MEQIIRTSVNCSVCGNAASKQCPCKGSLYCSRVCQKLDWILHKESCSTLNATNYQGAKNTSVSNSTKTIFNYMGRFLTTYSMFYYSLDQENFWDKYHNSKTNFTVFAPDNNAMKMWAIANNIAVYENSFNPDDDDGGGIMEAPTIARIEKNEKLLLILKGLFVDDTVPFTRGIEGVPGTGPIPRKSGLSAIRPGDRTNDLDLPTEKIEDLKDKRFEKAYGNLEIIELKDDELVYEKNTLKTAIEELLKRDKTTLTYEERVKLTLPYEDLSKYRVKYKNADIEVEIFDNANWVIRPREGLIYRLWKIPGILKNLPRSKPTRKPPTPAAVNRS